VDAQILTLDKEERKMSLGIKQMQEDPWFFERRQSLYALRKAVRDNQVPLLDFDTSTQELIAELKMS